MIFPQGINQKSEGFSFNRTIQWNENLSVQNSDQTTIDSTNGVKVMYRNYVTQVTIIRNSE